MKKIAVLALALAAAGAGAPALAVESGAFVRVEAGESQFDIDTDFGAINGLDDNSYGVRGGYYFSPNFAIEGFYNRYGDEHQDGVRVRFGGFGLGLVGKKNFGSDGNGFYISGRAGALLAKSEVRIDDLGSTDDNKLSPYLGIGIGYDFLPEFGIGLNYDYLRSKPELEGIALDVQAQTLTLGLEYRFIF